MTVATAEKRAATDNELTNARLLPILSPNIPQPKDPIAIASKVIETRIKHEL